MSLYSPGFAKALYPGDYMTLFSGTEVAALGAASAAFARGSGASGSGQTFNLSGVPAGMTVDVQCAATDVDADYTSLVTLTPDANGNAAYTDEGYSPFYRYKISAYTSGPMPVGTVNR